MTDPISPHSLEAEKAVLGAVLLHADVLGTAAAVVTAEDFFRGAHRQIFAAMLLLDGQRIAVDFTTVCEELTRRGALEAVGGRGYVAALSDGMARSTNVEHYARIISDKARLRRLIQAGTRLVAEAYDASEEATVILERAEQAILGLADGTVQAGFESMRQIAPRAMELLEQMRAKKDGIIGIPSGFQDLDVQTRGFQPGTLIVLGARPGVGKSSFATNLAQHAASLGHPVGMFSLEMPAEELFFRQVSSASRIDSHRIQSGYLSEAEWGRVSAAFTQIADAPIYLDETAAVGMFALRSRARRLKAQHGLALLVVDYLQLMGTAAEHDTRALAIGAITGALKGLAKELKIPIVLLSQLNRDSAKGDRPRRPQLSDLKDSGSIEQDADIVLFLHRSEDDDANGVTELLIAKHRNGPIGTVKLRWHERFTTFETYTPQPEPERSFR